MPYTWKSDKYDVWMDCSGPGFIVSPDITRSTIRTCYYSFEEAVEALREWHGTTDIPTDRTEWKYSEFPDRSVSPNDELLRLRASIDNLDAVLLHTLAERFKLTQQVGVLKANNDLPPSDKAREARQIERLRSLANEAGLDPEFAEKFLNFIVAEVIRHHEQIRSESTD